MNVLYVASEVAPFAVSGGLADVMGALPKAIASDASCGISPSVILPLYGSISEKWRSQMERIDEFEFMYGWRHAYCGIFRLEMNGVKYYFVDNEQYFLRSSLYGQYDDGERFAYFCRSVVEWILRTDETFDILHANDWQAALAVIYLKTRFSGFDKCRSIKTVYTIHNIEYQGKYDPYILGDIFDLDSRYLSTLEFDGCINLMKGAIVSADRVTTVSPTYARELKETFFAYGLSNIIRMNERKLSGIINGIDTEAFSPSIGTDIHYSFTAETVSEGKKQNKLALQKELGLREDAEMPLIVMITRLTHGKGIDLVLHVFEEIMQLNVQFVLLGTGEESYERIFTDLCARYGDRAKALIKFDRALSKQMYASADLFLMPSKSEPCGLAQMIACGYGTLPIVRKTGGLADSITPPDGEKANGFVFNNFNAHELLFTLKDAVKLYSQKDAWNDMVNNAMKTDFSWNISAKKYIDIYSDFVRK